MPVPKKPVWVWMQVSVLIAMFVLSLWNLIPPLARGSQDYCWSSPNGLYRRSDALLHVDAVLPASLISSLAIWFKP